MSLLQRLSGEIVASTIDAIIAFDSAGRVSLFNLAAERMFLVKANKVLGQSLHRLLPGVAEGHKRSVQGFGTGIVQALRSNGEDFSAEVSVSDFEVDGQHAFVAIVRDVSGRRPTEETLRETGQRLSLAVETAQLGTYERDLISNELRLNDACREILGLPKGVVPPVDIAQASAHPDDKKRVLAEVARAFNPALREICAAEFRVLRADGTVRWVAGRGRVIFDETVTPARPKRFLGVLLDITDRKLAEMELVRAKQELTLTNVELEKRVHARTSELEEMIVELEHMSYSMVHDMRAPLRAIRGFGEILELDPNSYQTDEARHLLEQMRRACHRMDQLVTGALNYNEAVRSVLPVGPVNVLQLLRDLLAMHPEFTRPRAEVTLEGRFQWVMGNEAGLAQCFAELMRNAVKFVHPPNLPRVRVWAKHMQNHKHALIQADGDPLPVNLNGGSNWVRLYFEDNGTGIPEKGLGRIFGMFQRAHGPEYPGTGVGLALVRKLIQRMGGSVGVESDEQNGSRFWLELPCPPKARVTKRIRGSL